MKDTFQISSWPTTTLYPGLANGWEGAAWTILQIDRKQPGVWNNRIASSVYNKLKRIAPPMAMRSYCSSIVGPSARPIIAALAGQNDIVFRKLLPKLIKQMTTHLEKSGLTSDLMLGKAGALLACAEINTLNPGRISKKIIKNLCTETKKTVLKELELISEKKDIYIGLSHGLAGYLLALEAAQTTFGFGLSTSLRNELIDTIANQRYEGPNGSAVWPVRMNCEPSGFHGWCHGGPGIGLAFLAGYSMTGKKIYKELASMALAGCVRFPTQNYSFCCGLTGKAQILIEGARILGEKKWLKNAAKIAKDAIKATPRLQRKKRGFHRGELGSFYLKQRLIDPSLPLLGLGSVSVIQ